MQSYFHFYAIQCKYFFPNSGPIKLEIRKTRLMSENFYIINTQNQYRQTLLKGLLDPGHVASTKT